jgi:hypothetical protein
MARSDFLSIVGAPAIELSEQIWPVFADLFDQEFIELLIHLGVGIEAFHGSTEGVASCSLRRRPAP